jgi:competence protein ComEC
MNPGGFDYEGWLFSRGIGATGYVRAEPAPRHLVAAPAFSVDALRAAVIEALQGARPQARNAGVLQALTVGERSAIPAQRWRTLVDTGTIHLMAISGLHIGLVAGLVYALVLLGWRRCARCCAWLAAPRAAAVLGLAAAVGYAVLAGFTLPTQRALVMLAVVSAALFWGRSLRPAQGLSVALVAVLALDPRAPLSPGFWLSFGAVAIILYSLSARLAAPGRLSGLLRLQWVLGLGLLVPLLWMFGEAPLVSPLANLIAVPWVSLLVVPPALAAVALLPLSSSLAGLLLGIADLALALLWPVLDLLQDLPLARWQAAQAAPWAFALAVLGLAILIAPRGWPARWLGLVLMLPLLLPAHPSPPLGSLRLTLLDVGQGLAVVARTRGHTLVFDVGARFGPRFDAGRAAVLPYLRTRGLRRIDRLIVSHGDNDHAGGLGSVLEGIEVDTLMLGPDLDHPRGEPCLRGRRWVWDGVVFSVLHPPPGPWGGGRNDGSCVLRIQTAGAAILLTADIEAGAERALAADPEMDLASAVLLVPHHGSRSSSSEVFIDRVAPELALLAVGHRNPYGLPRPEVLARYAARGIPVLDTARNGAITLEIGESVSVVAKHREQARRYWHARP